ATMAVPVFENGRILATLGFTWITAAMTVDQARQRYLPSSTRCRRRSAARSMQSGPRQIRQASRAVPEAANGNPNGRLNMRNKLAAVLLAGMALGACASAALSNASPAPAKGYVVAEIDVKDLAAYREYVAAAFPVIQQYG